jgi:hypothetical protein
LVQWSAQAVLRSEPFGQLAIAQRSTVLMIAGMVPLAFASTISTGVKGRRISGSRENCPVPEGSFKKFGQELMMKAELKFPYFPLCQRGNASKGKPLFEKKGPGEIY